MNKTDRWPFVIPGLSFCACSFVLLSFYNIWAPYFSLSFILLLLVFIRFIYKSHQPVSLSKLHSSPLFAIFGAISFYILENIMRFGETPIKWTYRVDKFKSDHAFWHPLNLCDAQFSKGKGRKYQFGSITGIMAAGLFNLGQTVAFVGT